MLETELENEIKLVNYEVKVSTHIVQLGHGKNTDPVTVRAI